MKLMTLNTHSLVESSYEEKKEKFIETLIAEQPDVVALQEVNQTASAGIIPDVMLAGYKRCMDFGLPVREDNHAKEVVEALREKDVYYYKRICDEQNFNRWVSDLHFKVILYKNDEHIFNWDDVNIMNVYGINEIGKWLAEVRIAYIEEGCNDLFYTIGTAEIEFE